MSETSAVSNVRAGLVAVALWCLWAGPSHGLALAGPDVARGASLPLWLPGRIVLDAPPASEAAISRTLVLSFLPEAEVQAQGSPRSPAPIAADRPHGVRSAPEAQVAGLPVSVLRSIFGATVGEEILTELENVWSYATLRRRLVATLGSGSVTELRGESELAIDEESTAEPVRSDVDREAGCQRSFSYTVPPLWCRAVYAGAFGSMSDRWEEW